MALPAGLTRQRVGLVLGPALFAAVLGAGPFGLAPGATAALACTAWIATWWVSEAIPIPATSLLPVVLFPVTDVLDVATAAAPYADPVVFLLLGGFLLAIAVERWDLHRRIALAVVAAVGASPARLVLGFMLATAFLSMWLSNSATAMLMVPIGTAVVVELGTLDAEPDDREIVGDVPAAADGGQSASPATDSGPSALSDRPADGFGLALLLGIAYSASIGGTATLIGSPPNAVFAGVAERRLGVRIGFLDWLVLAAPLAVVFLFVTWLVLLRLLRPTDRADERVASLVAAQRASIGRITSAERRVLAVFGLVAGGWALRPFVLQPVAPAITDTVVAVAGGVLLFVVPSGSDSGGALLDWEGATRVPWGVLVLLGSGFSLASAFQQSGLDAALADRLAALAGVPSLVVLAAVATVVVFLTEVTSNTATATVFVPVTISLALTIDAAPVPLMATAALAASFAFMLPVATPPNAVVFGSGYVTIPQMARVGLWLNLLGIVALVALTYLWLPIALGLVA